MRNILKAIYFFILKTIPPLRAVYYTRGYENPVTIKTLFYQKILRFNSNAYWPMHFTSMATNVKNIYVGVDVCPGLAPGCYIQGLGKVYIDDYTGIAANVGIISANHSLLDFKKHNAGTVKIGKYCWIGMNAVILPNVELGDFTTVAAGSVVTKSFKEGYCVLRGNPAEVIQTFLPDTHHHFIRNEHAVKYYGFIAEKNFDAFRKNKLTV